MKIVKKEYTGDGRAERSDLIKYPFAKLEVGDCLIIDGEEDLKKQLIKVRAAWYGYRRYNSLNWIVKAKAEEGKICLYRIF